MSGMIQLKVRPEHLKGPVPAAERRRYKRYSITLLGRYLRVLTKEEKTCRLLDMSIGGASLVVDEAPSVGERVIIQFDEIGSLEGEVLRSVPGGFAVAFEISHRRRQKLAAQLTWLLNRHELAVADQRRPGHDRIKVAPKPVRIEFADGTVQDSNVLDVSISGASIATDVRPAIGTSLVVGRFPGRVVRHHSRGIGVEFAHIHHLAAIREDFG